MSLTKKERLQGWGGYPAAECVSYRPEKLRDLRHIVQKEASPLLARGLGRSYGDASLQPAGVIRTERLDHLIQFDQQQGIIRAQAGVTLAELMEITIPKGWMIPVLPGTKFVTLGGAVACNVHGKNQFRLGDFAEHVISIRLMLPNGEMMECSAQSHSDIFWATAGGMGMTGVIEEITFKLLPIETASLRTLTYRVDSVDDMVAAFEHYRKDADYMVGWIDHMAKGGELGRGVFEAAYHARREDGGKACSDYEAAKTKLNVPVYLPSFVLNRYLMALYNKYRFKKYSSERKSETVGFNGFFHPLDAIGNWNKLYGKRGFFQYQCLIPETADVGGQLADILRFLQKNKLFSYLAVLKYHRPGQGLLPFSQQGYSLALDFPNTARVRAKLQELDQMVAERGGRIYLAKDANLNPKLFRGMYSETASEWLETIQDLDPQSRFTSLMSKRLQWKH